ncbi:MAG: DNA polymerase IV [Candidatus Sumerlaeia bacterium]
MQNTRIMHLDMDAFFASVEQRDRPELRGKAVLVGGKGPRSVVAACSYPARKYGIHSAMPMRRARELCPDAILVTPRFDRYREISAGIFQYLQSQVDLVEKTSVDEGYLDISKEVSSDRAAFALGKRIKGEILNRFDLVCSIGIAPCKFAAKIASDLKKPDALVLVPEERLADFLAPLDVGKIPGVGDVGRRKLHAIHVETIADLRKQPREMLIHMFGKWGDKLYGYARGIDPRSIVTHHTRKSISREHTFAIDVEDMAILVEELQKQAKRLEESLKKRHQKVRTVVLKLRYENFESITRQESYAHPMQSAGELLAVGERLLMEKTEALARPVRLIGLGVTGFENEDADGELTLF